MVETSVVQAEVEQFGKLAGDWWDPKGASAMLHKLNPVRLGLHPRLDRPALVARRAQPPSARGEERARCRLRGRACSRSRWRGWARR